MRPGVDQEENSDNGGGNIYLDYQSQPQFSVLSRLQKDKSLESSQLKAMDDGHLELSFEEQDSEEIMEENRAQTG